MNEISYLEALKVLSPREVEVLDLVIDGYSTSEIANHLSLSNPTIEAHKRNISSKIGISGKKAINKWGIKAKYKQTNL